MGKHNYLLNMECELDNCLDMPNGETAQELVKINYDKGMSKLKRGEAKAALEDIDEALGVCKWLGKEDRLTQPVLMGLGYLYKGYALEKMGEPGHALSAYDDSVEILEFLKYRGKPYSYLGLSKAFKARMRIKTEMGHTDDPRYVTGATIRRHGESDRFRLDEDARLLCFGHFAITPEEFGEPVRMESHGFCVYPGKVQPGYRAEDLILKALDSIRYGQFMVRKYRLYFDDEMRKQRVETVRRLDVSIEILEFLRLKGSDYSEDLMEAYDTRARLKFKLKDYAGDLHNAGQALAIARKIKPLEEVAEEMDRVAHNSMVRGEELDRAGAPDEAMVYHETSVTLFEELNNSGLLKDRAMMAKAYRARSFTEIWRPGGGDFEKALGDQQRALDILEDMHERGLLLDESGIAVAYRERGDLNRRGRRFKSAGADYDKAIEILVRLYNNKQLLKDTDLAFAYYQRHLMYAGIENLLRGAEDLARAFALLSNARRNKEFFAPKLYLKIRKHLKKYGY